MLISSSSDISDEFSIKESIFLSIVLRNEANSADDYQNEEDREKEFD